MSDKDNFLMVEGIPGESADSKHKGEIDVESFSLGCTQSGSMAYGGGGGTGKVQFQDFHFNKRCDKASSKLMLACATGQHIKKAVLTVRKAGGDQMEYLKITMEDCLVSSYQVGGASSTVPTEQCSINFAKITYDYTPQKADGTAEGKVSAGWDIKANKKA